MALFYITGVSATGKSTVLSWLAAQGIATYDDDEGGISAWYDRHTGIRVSRPTRVDERTEAWYEGHVWRISRDKVTELADRHGRSRAFLCGSTLSDTEVWDLFSKVFCLTLDEPTLNYRLLTRTNNDWGKAPSELKHVLSWREPWERMYRERGAIMVDASSPVTAVGAEILNSI